MVIGLLVSCVQQQQGTTKTSTVTTETSSSSNAAKTDNQEMITDDEIEDDTTTEDNDYTESEQAETITIDISQDELDQLKEDLEEMEFEDLGGLIE